MDAGKLDRRALLFHRVLTRDVTTGEMVESWPLAYATLWVGRLDLRSRDYFAAQQVQNDTTTKFLARWRTDVRDTDHIECAGVMYRIIAIAELGRRDGLELMCTTLTNEGVS
jgi:SPP1 family predicted phage head-tail adaptor